MTFLVILCVVGGLVFGYVYWGSATPESEEQYFISTSGQSAERVKNLGLDQPSEDASHILNPHLLQYQPDPSVQEKLDYRANPKHHWIIELSIDTGATFDKDELWKLFDRQWREENPGATLYGIDAETGHWTYVVAGGAPLSFTRLELGINLLEVFNGEQPDFSPARLEAYYQRLSQQVQSFAQPLDIQRQESAEVAVEKARDLVEFVQQNNRDAIIVLHSDQPYAGMQAWDALNSIGLEWGDGDLFHWNNEDQDFGGDAHFSVWTTSSPGYFLPESIKDGSMNPTDLIFGYSIARSVDPKSVWFVMLEAAQYCQKRLGGVLLSQNGHPLNAAMEEALVDEIAGQMSAKGHRPGSEEVLSLF